jgi:hypothetical protein
VILPWTARNYFVMGGFVPISTNGGLTLLGGNNPTANGDDTENDPLLKSVPHDVAHQVAADRLARSLAIHWVEDHPAAFALLVPKKVWHLWARDGESEWAYQYGYSAYDKYWMIFRAVRVLNQAYYFGLMLLFALSLWICVRERQWPGAKFATGYVLVVFTTAISVIFSGQSRFRFPVMPFVAMYAAWSVLHLAVRARAPSLRAAA